jgi:hypothetical protein
VLIIRHGESEYNKAADGRNLADPNIFDPKLTAAGHRQVRPGWAPFPVILSIAASVVLRSASCQYLPATAHTATFYTQLASRIAVTTSTCCRPCRRKH